ncbi:hypothetical protein CRG98_021173 [Punica granatum]|uniref:Uncharacterized protein n=1 Tax=Punica granatum TaxID=22663 RepID=A0A2I0JQ47_PUNGR|nr:hypothetical protein CRG98_021173 [Punica granatum]
MKEHNLCAIPMRRCTGSNRPGRRRVSMLKDMHRVRRECVWAWARWRRARTTRKARSVVLVGALGCMRKRVLGHVMMCSVALACLAVEEGRRSQVVYPWRRSRLTCSTGWGGQDGLGLWSCASPGEVKTASDLPLKVGKTACHVEVLTVNEYDAYDA